MVFILARKKLLRALGWALVGIGFLFLGIQWMKEGFETFQQAFDLTEFAMTGLGGLLVYSLVGIVATVILQSSHTTLIIVITALASGQITYDNALAISIGANIGAAVSTGLAAITTNTAGRRLVAVDLGSGWLGIADDSHTLKLALFHTLFKLVGVLVMVPLIGPLVRLLETKMQPAAVKLDRPKYISTNLLETPSAVPEAVRRELLRLFRRAFSHIVGFMAHLSVEGKRTQQPVLMRVASQDLIEAVKDAKHLQKNMIEYLQPSHAPMRKEYLDLRNLGYLLARLDELASATETQNEDIDLDLAELAARIEEDDIVNNGRLDQLIRNNRITAEQATSLKNDNTYSYRMAQNLLSMARASFQPFAELDPELRDAIELNPGEVRALLADLRRPETPDEKPER